MDYFHYSYICDVEKKIPLTRCRNPFETIKSSASVAEVSKVTHSGFLVMIWLTAVVLK